MRPTLQRSLLPAAVAVRYDGATDRVLVILDTGVELAFAPRLVQGLGCAEVDDLTALVDAYTREALRIEGDQGIMAPFFAARYDFDQENYTRLLWVFEGFTSYYDDLMLLRSGVISKRRYLKSLESTINQVLRNPSRKVQSLAESSFDAWIKYYRQDENAANAVVSYYAKGAIVALCIDLLLRRESNQETSLDDFMRLLWHRYGKDFYHQERPTDNNARGLDEEGFVPLLFEACGIEAIAKREAMTLQIKQWVEGRVELPLGDLLASAGVRLSYKPTALTHGMRYSINQQQMMINAVLIGSAAHEAGLSAGDQILAIDGLRASESRLKEAIERCEAPIDVVAFRRDELFCTTLKPLPETNPEVILEFDTA